MPICLSSGFLEKYCSDNKAFEAQAAISRMGGRGAVRERIGAVQESGENYNADGWAPLENARICACFPAAACRPCAVGVKNVRKSVN